MEDNSASVQRPRPAPLILSRLTSQLPFDEHLSEITSQLQQNSSTLDSSSPYENSPGFLSDLWQTQLALWTFTFSTVFTSLYQKRVRIRSIVYASVAIGVATFLSGVLALLVIVAHIFNKDFFSACYNSYNGSETYSDESGCVSPRKTRSLSVSSYCSDARSRHSSGTCSPKSPYNINPPIFWQRKMSMEHSYFGSVSSSR